MLGSLIVILLLSVLIIVYNIIKDIRSVKSTTKNVIKEVKTNIIKEEKKEDKTDLKSNRIYSKILFKGKIYAIVNYNYNRDTDSSNYELAIYDNFGNCEEKIKTDGVFNSLTIIINDNNIFVLETHYIFMYYKYYLTVFSRNDLKQKKYRVHMSERSFNVILSVIATNDNIYIAWNNSYYELENKTRCWITKYDLTKKSKGTGRLICNEEDIISTENTLLYSIRHHNKKLYAIENFKDNEYYKIRINIYDSDSYKLIKSINIDNIKEKYNTYRNYTLSIDDNVLCINHYNKSMPMSIVYSTSTE